MYYELYIDVLFLVNFMMDYILLLLTGKILKLSVTHSRICVGAFLSAVLTCVIAVLPISHAFVQFILFHTVVNVVMIKVGLGVKWDHVFIKSLLTLYISGFLVGGIFTYFDQYVKTGSLFFAMAIVSYYIASGTLNFLTALLHFGQYFCQVELYVGKQVHSVKALLDTGNRLTDALTGKAVSIIDKEVADILFEGKLPEKIRYIPYHSIGKNVGVIPVVTLDSIHICGKDEEWIEFPLVGISDKTLSIGREYEMILNPYI